MKKMLIEVSTDKENYEKIFLLSWGFVKTWMPTHRSSAEFSLHALPSMQVSRKCLWLIQQAASSNDVIKTTVTSEPVLRIKLFYQTPCHIGNNLQLKANAP